MYRHLSTKCKKNNPSQDCNLDYLLIPKHSLSSSHFSQPSHLHILLSSLCCRAVVGNLGHSGAVCITEGSKCLISTALGCSSIDCKSLVFCLWDLSLPALSCHYFLSRDWADSICSVL